MTYSEIYNAMYGRGAKPQLEPLDRQAWEVIRFFYERGGFDHWWDRIDVEIKDEIFDELRAKLRDFALELAADLAR